MVAQPPTRIERDAMGEMAVPADAYYGSNTMRAVLNFPISDLRFPPGFIRALAQIKQAAAEVNRALGLLDEQRAEAISRAAQEIVEGKHDVLAGIGIPLHAAKPAALGVHGDQHGAGPAGELGIKLAFHAAQPFIVHTHIAKDLRGELALGIEPF